MARLSSWTAALAVGSFVPLVTSAQAVRPDAALTSYIDRALHDWNGVGLAIAVVRGDSVIYARGFGRRDVRRPEPVDANTVFAIGSMTKFFTAVAAGMVVESGKMGWDEPLTKYVPALRVADPYVTANLSLRDALTHRSGLDWKLDFLWLQTGLTETQLVERMRDFVPDPGFRMSYGYSNIMFAVAGQAVAAAAGQQWGDVIRDRVFVPLDMRSSSTTIVAAKAAPNVATPHVSFGGPPAPIEWINLANVAAAGAINSTVLDLSHWLRFAIHEGRYQGRQLLGEPIFREITSPQMIVGAPESVLRSVSNFRLYGMGVEVMDYRGYRLLQHSGKIDGMRAAFAVIPGRQLGVVILTNTSGPAGVPDLPEALVYSVLDRLLGAPNVDWSRKFLDDRTSVLKHRREAETRAAGQRVANTAPSRPLQAYAGTYAGPIGNAPLAAPNDSVLRRVGPFASVTVENGGLFLRFGPIASPLEHWDNDTFRLEYAPVGHLLATFTLDQAGQVHRLQIDFVGQFKHVAGPQ